MFSADAEFHQVEIFSMPYESFPNIFDVFGKSSRFSLEFKTRFCVTEQSLAAQGEFGMTDQPVSGV